MTIHEAPKEGRLDEEPAGVEGGPAMHRPHRHDSTEVLKDALARTSADAQRYAQTGPKKWEDAMHVIADQFLDELRLRGEL